MADTPTSRNRLRKQEIGAKTNAWGTDLNEDGGSDRLDEALDGVESYTLSGDKTLTSTDYETDEARMRVQNITGGTGGTITIPAVEKNYLIRNAASGDVTITNGSNSIAVKAGNITPVFTDGVDIYQARVLDYGAELLKSSGLPTDAAHLVNKAYVDNAALSSALPGQAGNAGKVLTTDGSTASFGNVNLASAVTGVLPVANGGTGVSSLAAGAVDFLQTPTSANLRSLVTDEVGTGALYFVGGALGTPASANLANATGLPVAGGISGMGANVAAFLADPTSAKLAAALTDETGTGAAVFATHPTFAASTTDAASLNIAPGVAPSSPVNGDLWTTALGLYARINGATTGPFTSILRQLAPDQTTSSGLVSAVTFSGLTANCSALLLQFKDLASTESAGTPTLRLTMKKAGGAAANNVSISATGAILNNVSFSGSILIVGHQRDRGLAIVGLFNSGGDHMQPNSAANPIIEFAFDSPVAEVGLALSQGNFSANSTFSLWGF